MAITDLTVTQAEEATIQEFLSGITVGNVNAQPLYDAARDSVVPGLGGALRILEHSIRRQAALDILPDIANSTYTATQVRSVLYGAMLARVKVVNYASFELTFNLLKTIRDEGLAQIHPENYTQVRDGEDQSFLQMAEMQANISRSVASDIMSLGEVILPYFQDVLEMPRHEVWDRINITNLRMMVPIMRYLIGQATGQDGRAPQARVVERVEMVGIRAAGDELGIDVEPDGVQLRTMTDAERRIYLAAVADNRARAMRIYRGRDLPTRTRMVAQWLLNNAETHTTARFANLVAGRDQEPIDGLTYRSNGTVTLFAVITEAQLDALQAAMRTRLTVRQVDSLTEIINLLRTPHVPA